MKSAFGRRCSVQRRSGAARSAATFSRALRRSATALEAAFPCQHGERSETAAAASQPAGG
jgi:hypothetical protein